MNPDDSDWDGYSALQWLEDELRRLQAERRKKNQLLTVLKRIVEAWEQTGNVGVDLFVEGREAIDQATGHKTRKGAKATQRWLDEVKTTVDILRQNPLIDPPAQNLLTKAVDRLDTMIAAAEKRDP